MADLLIAIGSSMAALPRIGPERVLALYAEFKRLYGLGMGGWWAVLLAFLALGGIAIAVGT